MGEEFYLQNAVFIVWDLPHLIPFHFNDQSTELNQIFSKLIKKINYFLDLFLKNGVIIGTRCLILFFFNILNLILFLFIPFFLMTISFVSISNICIWLSSCWFLRGISLRSLLWFSKHIFYLILYNWVSLLQILRNLRKWNSFRWVIKIRKCLLYIAFLSHTLLYLTLMEEGMNVFCMSCLFKELRLELLNRLICDLISLWIGFHSNL